MREVLVNKDIPRTMTIQGLDYLARLATTVPENGTIVEVGPLFGSSTWVLAKNAHPSVKVISIDTWEPAAWINEVEAKFPGCKPFSQDAFLHYTRDCPNVRAVQGWSPQVMGDWSGPLDLFFDDATHGDPGFSDSLDFYLPRLRPGGIACGDDYASGWPDIVRGVRRLGERWKAFPEIIGRVWAMTKPHGDAPPASIYSRCGPYSSMDIGVEVQLADGASLSCPPGVWAGYLHRNALLTGIRIVWAAAPAELSGVYQVLDQGGRRSAWVPFGELASTGEPIRSFRGHLVGNGSRDHTLAYQGCLVDRRSRTSNTAACHDGRWITSDDKSASLCALRCFVQTAGGKVAASAT